METSRLFATSVESHMDLLPGVVRLNWRNSSDKTFDHVAIYRKVNDFCTNPLDSYSQLVYSGKAEQIYDYSLSKPATEDYKIVKQAIIGEWVQYESRFVGKIPDPLDADTLYYYTIFSVDKDGKHHFSNATRISGMPSRNHGLGDILYQQYLPDVYRREDTKQSYELKRYIQVIGHSLDYLMTKAQNMSLFMDIDKCPPEYLPYIAKELDWELDSTLPISSQRQALKNAINVYRMAGTKIGLDILVKTNSGFPNSSGVTESRGLVLNSTYFGYYDFELIRDHETGTPDFRPVSEGGDDLSLIGQAGDPLKYTFDFAADSRQSEERFVAYVRKTHPITPEEEEQMRYRLTKLLKRFSPAGSKFDIDVY